MKRHYRSLAVFILLAILIAAQGATPVRAATLTVTKLADTNDGVCNADCSLREAIAVAAPGDTIVFAGSLSGGIIHLTLGTLTLSRNVTIDGSSLATPITVSGDNAVRVFWVNSGVTVSLNQLTVTEGRVTGGVFDRPNSCGAGILNAGTVILTNVTLSDNSGQDLGGGLYNDDNGSATLTNVTFSGNSALSGGAMFNLLSSVTLTNVTFSGNSASSGGAMRNFESRATLTNVTFSGNTAASGFCGAMQNWGGNVTVRNSILWGDIPCESAFVFNGPTFTDSVVQGGCPSGSTCTNLITSNPLLGALGDYGGRTRTIPLLPGSSAIDTGNDAICSAAPVSNVDQRGVPRSIFGAHCDIGAFESRGFTLTISGGDNQSAAITTAFAQPLTLNVTSPFGEPVDGGQVVFTAPLLGASTNPTTNTATVAGGAVSQNVTANGTDGSYSVAAAASGAASVGFNLTNVLLPDTTITAQPSNPSPSDAATFAFSGSYGAPPLNFECDLDGSGFGPCTSPQNYTGLTEGNHTFQVQAVDSLGITDPTPASYTWVVDTAPPTVIYGGSTTPDNNSVLFPGPNRIVVEFSEDVVADGGANAANTLANYLLVEGGVNGIFDTIACGGPGGGLQADDALIAINSVAYANGGGAGPFLATLNINSGTTLPIGNYRLFICGTTSVYDPTGNRLNNGADSLLNFNVRSAVPAIGGGGRNKASSLPGTGFAPGRVTLLPPQTVSYSDLGDLWLEIPKLGLKMPIVGVPKTDNGWDVSWLGSKAGWLEGSAYPSWNGNSVLTGHVWNADNSAGPFRYLNTLWWGDKVIVHIGVQQYIYEVRSVKQVAPTDINTMMRHEELPWLTLVTCKSYDEDTGGYRYRILVRAVLIEVK